ncbi:hypothetical protein [Lactobacillus gigeriorum]|uniref:Uncharacterized protein n=1 Tax=Lactobacillus gigeriorum DSM 23908 = CRBIP 24.85 TaxID=1423751 RepID=I7LCJ7_9LACO|nr:hypothetical protein [Lactobacillus gigeriorum]KRN14448.1 hypothetical protein FC38_GL001110 [Lactobacillus gigeriorum DSM 23908 = CRBIP 24.85]CCI86546.1 Protein of unknown function [Lactobacillus gigeriorum DSM 23908 = CRBIP 24.85]
MSDAQKDAILQLGGDALKDAKPEDMKYITVKSASASNSNGEFQQVVTLTVMFQLLQREQLFTHSVR